MYPLGKTVNGKQKMVSLSSAYARLGLSLDQSRIVPVPCGKCKGCLDSKIRDWRSRLILESKSNPPASFITLTYRDSDLPSSPSKRHLQLFLKRLRNASRDYGVPPFALRYFLVSEYGDKTHRLHYHGLLFGVDLLTPAWSPKHVGFNRKGYPLYCSEVLGDIWPYGFNTVDHSTDSATSYLVNYILADDSNNICLYSQGIGRGFVLDSPYKPKSLNKYGDTIFRRGNFVHGRMDSLHSSPLPRSLYRYAEKYSPDLYELIKTSRRQIAAEMSFSSPSEVERHIIHKWKESKENKTL